MASAPSDATIVNRIESNLLSVEWPSSSEHWPVAAVLTPAVTRHAVSCHICYTAWQTDRHTVRVINSDQSLLAAIASHLSVEMSGTVYFRTSQCHACAQTSANVHLATPVPLRGTTCLKICAPLQTRRSSDSSWRLTFLLELLMFSDFRPSVLNVLSDSCNALMFRL